MDPADKPTMEDILVRYKEMQAKMTARLDAEVATRQWTTDDEDIWRSGCGDESDDPLGEHASLPLIDFTGTYAEEDWHRARDIVQEVGREYGFTETRSITDRPGDLDIYGEDTYGGNYSFGMGKNTVFQISTGCHRWVKVPDVDPDEYPGPPE